MTPIEGELWRPVIGFEDYHVSNFGRVKRVKAKTHNPHIMRQTLNRGYCNVCICKDNIKYTKRVHRLVAFSFLKKVHGKPYINHKDGDRANNLLNNLEWYRPYSK